MVNRCYTNPIRQEVVVCAYISYSKTIFVLNKYGFEIFELLLSKYVVYVQRY